MDNVIIPAGRLVVAVSGGVDSMCLLHALAANGKADCVVAHFNHRQRTDAAEDVALVRATARRFGFSFYTADAEPDISSDENTLRNARYAFLRSVLAETGSQVIVTAHHQDDLLETIIMKLLRGTNRRGLSPMQASADIVRPMLGVSKRHIYDYAVQQAVEWREDTTNTDQAYLRNHIRIAVMPRMHDEQRAILLAINQTMTPLNEQIDTILADRLQPELDRPGFITDPHIVSREYLAAWLRQNGIADFSRDTLERLTIAAKTLPAGKAVDVQAGTTMRIKRRSLALETSERYNKETYGQEIIPQDH